MTSISKSGQLVIKRRGAQVRRDSLATSLNFGKNLYCSCFAGKKEVSPFSPTLFPLLPPWRAWSHTGTATKSVHDLSPQVFVQHGDWLQQTGVQQAGDVQRSARVSAKEVEGDWTPAPILGRRDLSWPGKGPRGVYGTPGRRSEERLHGRGGIGNSDVLFEHPAPNIYKEKHDSLEPSGQKLSRPRRRETRLARLN